MSVEQTTTAEKTESIGAVAVPNGAASPPALAASPRAGESQAPQKRSVTLEVPNLDEARKQAAEQLQVPPAELVVRVLEKHKKGFLGMGGEVLKVEATWTPPPPVINGRVELTCERGKLSMTVIRPEGRGKSADVSVLDAQLEGLPLDARDEAAITQAFRNPDGKPHFIGLIAPSVKPADDAPVAVKVTSDENTAFLIPWAPAPLTIQAIMDALVEAGVTAGIDESKLEEIEGKPLAAPMAIAHGEAVVEGTDARPEFLLPALGGKAEEKDKPAAAGNAQVDFRDLGGQPTVEVGAELVRLVPAVPGKDGFTVRGQVMPAKEVKDFDLQKLAGQNVGLNEDGTVLVSKQGGLPTKVGERVAVMPIYSVQGDVDFNTGNLDFDGNIMISGGVKPGFRVHASGNIQIGGTVEAAQIEAGADITVNGGIVGQNEAVIRAGGTITARFVEAAELHAKGAIMIGSEIRQSTAIAEGKVVVAGPGRIVGGQVRGRESVEARVLGSSSGSPTSIQAGWGEEMTVEDMDSKRIPKVMAGQEVNAGVVITVAGASQRFTHSQTGGVWRNKDGKVQYSAS